LLRNRGEVMRYKIAIYFETNQEIDEFEIEDLLAVLLKEVEEPKNFKGEQAQYETKEILIDLENL